METTYRVRETPATPQDLEAEQAVLGALLIDTEAAANVFGNIAADDFYLEKNRWIFEAASALHAHGEQIDTLTIRAELEKRGRAKNVESDYLVGLLNATPTATYGVSYAGLVRDRARKRRLLYASTQIAGWAYDDKISADDAEAKAQGELLKLTTNSAGARYYSAYDAAGELMLKIADRFANPRELIGVSTGYIDFDAKLKGFQAGLIVLGAVTSMGKTSLMLGSALNTARKSKTRAAIITLEMTRDELMTRLISYLSDVPTDYIETCLSNGKPMDDDTYDNILKAEHALSVLPLFFVEMSGATSSQIRAKITELKAREDIQVVYVDHAQLMTDKADNRNNELDAATRNLLSCAKTLGIPIVLASQLKRGIEARSSHIPTLSDFRDSGGIEQNADVCIGVLREDYYHRFEENYKQTNDFGLYFLKDRLGSSAGKATVLRWIEKTARIENASRD